MPDFSSREKELRSSFETMAPHLKQGERVECPVRLANLYPARAQALAGILEPLQDLSTDAKARAVEDRIQNFVDRWVLPFSRLCDGLLYPSDELDGWREYEVTREMKCMQGLFDLEIGEARDALAALESGLVEMIANLEKKWATMGEEARRIERIEAEASEKMSAIVTQGIHDGADAIARYGYAIGQVLDVCNKLPDLVNEAIVAAAKECGLPDVIANAIPKVSLLGKDYFQFGKDNGLSAADLARANPELFRDPGMYVSESIQKALGPEFEMLVTVVNAFRKNVVPALNGRYAEQVMNVRRLLPNHGAILVTFSQTRRDVDTFLKEHGLDKARELCDRVDEKMLGFISSLSTDGQKADLREWAEAVRVPFRKRYDNMANIFGVFVQQHQGRFIGSVSKAVENELIFTDERVERGDGLLGLSMDERLNEWRKNTLQVSDTLATASSQMMDKLQGLPSDIRDNIVKALNDYWGKVAGQVKAEAVLAVADIDAAAPTLSDENIRTTMDSRPLQQYLAA